MACCKKKKLQQLVEACVADKLFEPNLKTSVFKCVVEIIKNAKTEKFADCFSQKTHGKIKKQRKLLKKLINSKISIKKRKQKFISSPKTVRKLFYNYILHDFVQNCLEHD